MNIKLNIKPGEPFLTISRKRGIKIFQHICKRLTYSETGLEIEDERGVEYPEQQCYHDIIALRLAFDYAVDELSDEIRRQR